MYTSVSRVSGSFGLSGPKSNPSSNSENYVRRLQEQIRMLNICPGNFLKLCILRCYDTFALFRVFRPTNDIWTSGIIGPE